MILDRILLHKIGRQHHEQLGKKVQNALENSIQRQAVTAATRQIRQKSLQSYSATPNLDEILRESREIKRESIRDLTVNVEKFISRAEGNGTKVFVARTKEDAVNYVVNTLSNARVRRIIKSKSMASEELELNNHLQDSGFIVTETDLGERIIQLAGQKPSHIVAPSVHLTVKEVAKIFSENLHADVPGVAETITQLARENLRSEFLNADAGISGANFAVADDGSILIVTNEGNDRLVTSLPRVYIAIVGIEKIVPSLDQALQLTETLCLSATGQRMTSYVTVIKGPNGRAGSADPNEKREMHIVLLDNERSVVAKDPIFSEALYCLKCAACLNVCPTYRQVSGHVFGYNYTGPIGIPWTAFTSNYSAAAEFAPLCLSCGLCKMACPEDINIPLLIAKVKEVNVKSEGQLPVNWFLSRYESFVRFISLTAPLSNRLLRNSVFRGIVERAVGIDRRRIFPEFSRNTFESWARKQEHLQRPQVAYFVDTYANFNRPDIGKTVWHILSAMGYDVIVPKQEGSGMPAFLYGELSALRRTAEFNVKAFLPYANRGIPILASEPTAAFCLRELYPTLNASEDSRLVAKNTFEIIGFLLEHWDRLASKLKRLDDGGKIAYHTPCHMRPLHADPPGPHLLRKLGLDIESINFDGCCGIGGTYGFKKGLDGFDVSMSVGEELFDRIREMKPRYVVTESSVCKIQIEQGLGLTVKHPLEILAKALCET